MGEQNKTEALLPCPFCGASASGYAIEPHSHALSVGDWMMPDHKGSYVIEGDCACGSGLIGETRAEVIARWNTRAATPKVEPAEQATNWQEPHPPSRHCMCPSCIPSFDDQFAAQQATDADEDAHVIARLGELLAGVAIALKGEELPRRRHGYSDLPELAQKMKLELDLYRAAFPNGVPDAALAAQQAPAQPAGSERFCNKCGYFGPDQLHQRPNGSGQCGYLSIPCRPQPAAHSTESTPVEQAMAIINAAWMAVPEQFRNPDADDQTGNPLPAAIRALAASKPAAPAQPLEKWVDDPHDIEQGQMLNPEWLKANGLTAQEAAAQPPAKVERAPIQGERFVRAWLKLEELPGAMMTGPEGRFGPIPASTSCFLTTSERERDQLLSKGEPVLEVWTRPFAKVEREALTDDQIHDVADDFKSQYQHGGTTFPEFDYLGFARALGIPAPTVGEKENGK